MEVYICSFVRLLECITLLDCLIRGFRNYAFLWFFNIFLYISGERLIDLNNVQYLALDWNNNPKQKGYVKVTEQQPVLVK